jgi:hemolysin D
MASARKVVAFRPKAADRAREELAFLPAALEVVETPPSPVGRGIAAAIALFFCLAVAWACWGEVDIIASAQGRIIPSGNIKLIQPFETGVIRSIDVKDGQRVKAGDTLIELDPTMNAAELGHLQGDLVATQLELERLRAALVDNVDPLTEFRAPKGASAAQVETQRQFLVSQNGEFRAKLAVLKRQQEQKEAERATIGATVAKLEATLPIVQERFDVRKTLYGKELGAKLQYLEAQQQLVEMQQELAVQKSRYREVTAALTVLTETNAQTIAEYRRTRFGEFAEADRKVAGLIQDLVKAEQRTKLQLLTAPVDGIVQQLAVHTIGGVVTPAQTLLCWCRSTAARDRGDGAQPGYRLCPCRPGSGDQDRYLQFHQVRHSARQGAERFAGRHFPRQAAGQAERQVERHGERHERATGPGTWLPGAHIARSHPDAGWRRAGQPYAGHGRHGRDQDGIADVDELPAVAAAQVQAGKPREDSGGLDSAR